MQNDNQEMPETGQTPADNPMPESSGGRAKKHVKKLNIFAGKEKAEALILLAIIIFIAAGAFFYGKHSENPLASDTAVKTSGNSSSASSVPASTTTPKLPDAEFLSGNTYLSIPKKLGDLGFITDYKALGCLDGCDPSTMGINYYQIGSTSSGQRIIDLTYAAGLGGSNNVFAIEKSSGSYSLLAQNDRDPASFATYWQSSLSSNTSIDEKTKLDDIKMPLEATISNQKMKVLYAPDSAKNIDMSMLTLMKNGLPSIRGGYYEDVSTSDVKKLGTQDNIDFYEVTVSDTANYKVMEYHAAFKQLFTNEYSPNGEIARTSDAISINWTSGTNNKSSYFSSGQGCGSFGYVIAKNVDASDLSKVGTTLGGQAVYQLPQNNALVQEIYTKDYDQGQNLDNDSLKNLSIDQFTKQHGYFLAKNGLGEYVLFLRSDMIFRGGCAKPVIYLYPQRKQQVSVKVGAQVVNSDPAYGSGWDNVTAYPDGSLSYGGKVYGSLFWDGYGYGSYPDIDSGTIVKTSDAVSTVKDQLAKQGLSGQETSDFLNYWMPKLEAISQPYTRLTWFNTAQMNRLAPLDISPAPQTLIRVFLDFQGLNKPYALKSPHLTSLSRQGFTVVEWGGLARNGLDR